MDRPDHPSPIVLVGSSRPWQAMLRGILGDDPHLRIAGAAADAASGTDLVARIGPALAIADARLPEGADRHLSLELARRGLRLPVVSLEGPHGHREQWDLRFVPPGMTDAPGFAPKRVLPQTIVPRLRAILATAETPRPAATAAPAPPWATPGTPATPPPIAAPTPEPRPLATRGDGATDVLVVGVSTGGPETLARIIPRLPADFGLPVLIVQHMPAGFTRLLAEDLDRRSALEVREGANGMEIRPGRVIIAPGGRHMSVAPGPRPPVVVLEDGPPIESCRPSVERLLDSAADRWGRRTLVLMLTGMGQDGQAGCTRLHRLGAPILCQSAATCVVHGMPKLPTRRGQAAAVVDLPEIPGELVRRGGGSGVRAGADARGGAHAA